LQFGKIDVTEGQFVVMGVMIVSSVSSFMELDIWNINVSSVPTPFAQSKSVAAMERLAESRNYFLSTAMFRIRIRVRIRNLFF
jgi:hypothetical protein